MGFEFGDSKSGFTCEPPPLSLPKRGRLKVAVFLLETCQNPIREGCQFEMFNASMEDKQAGSVVLSAHRLPAASQVPFPSQGVTHGLETVFAKFWTGGFCLKKSVATHIHPFPQTDPSPTPPPHNPQNASHIGSALLPRKSIAAVLESSGKLRLGCSVAVAPPSARVCLTLLCRSSRCTSAAALCPAHVRHRAACNKFWEGREPPRELQAGG